MIDIKELRVGAHISVLGERVEVDEIINTSLVGYITPNNDWLACSPDEDYIQPIPITAELLQELGFESVVREILDKPYEEWYKDICGYPIRVMKGYSNKPGGEWSVHIDSWDYDTIGSADLEYLHQLEAIIYLSTGEELIKEE